VTTVPPQHNDPSVGRRNIETTMRNHQKCTPKRRKLTFRVWLSRTPVRPASPTGVAVGFPRLSWGGDSSKAMPKMRAKRRQHSRQGRTAGAGTDRSRRFVSAARRPQPSALPPEYGSLQERTPPKRSSTTSDMLYAAAAAGGARTPRPAVRQRPRSAQRQRPRAARQDRLSASRQRPASARPSRRRHGTSSTSRRPATPRRRQPLPRNVDVNHDSRLRRRRRRSLDPFAPSRRVPQRQRREQDPPPPQTRSSRTVRWDRTVGDTSTTSPHPVRGSGRLGGRTLTRRGSVSGASAYGSMRRQTKNHPKPSTTRRKRVRRTISAKTGGGGGGGGGVAATNAAMLAQMAARLPASFLKQHNTKFARQQGADVIANITMRLERRHKLRAMDRWWDIVMSYRQIEAIERDRADACELTGDALWRKALALKRLAVNRWGR